MTQRRKFSRELKLEAVKLVLERPIAWVWHPFSVECRTLGLDVGAADRGAAFNRPSPCQGIEQFCLEAAPRPTVEAIVDRSRRAIIRWAVAPAAARF